MHSTYLSSHKLINRGLAWFFSIQMAEVSVITIRSEFTDKQYSLLFCKTLRLDHN